MSAAPGGLFDGLFDDAALFPPGESAMADAVPAHVALHVAAGDLVGPFVVPAGRLDELAGVSGDADLRLAVIAGPGDLAGALDRVAASPRLEVAAVEVPPPADTAAAHRVVAVATHLLPSGVPVSVELPRSPHRDAVLDVLAAAGLRAKVRTGGLRAELFPPARELADTLAACLARGVPVKCTAGLHAALPHTDPATGFDHHGFLGVLLAVDALAAGGSTTDAAAALSTTSRSAVTQELRGWAPQRAHRARAAFTSFGTCSVAEPIADLRVLGLLPPLDRIPS